MVIFLTLKWVVIQSKNIKSAKNVRSSASFGMLEIVDEVLSNGTSIAQWW